MRSLLTVLFLVLGFAFQATAAGTDVQRITVDELKAKLDRGEKVLVLDTRSPVQYSMSKVKIKGAVRIPYHEIDQRAAELPVDREIITYCT